jgi:hypothetical protein
MMLLGESSLFGFYILASLVGTSADIVVAVVLTLRRKPLVEYAPDPGVLGRGSGSI